MNSNVTAIHHNTSTALYVYCGGHFLSNYLQHIAAYLFFNLFVVGFEFSLRGLLVTAVALSLVALVKTLFLYFRTKKDIHLLVSFIKPNGFKTLKSDTLAKIEKSTKFLLVVIVIVCFQAIVKTYS